jgi:hypothetical protein
MYIIMAQASLSGKQNQPILELRNVDLPSLTLDLLVHHHLPKSSYGDSPHSSPRTKSRHNSGSLAISTKSISRSM